MATRTRLLWALLWLTACATPTSDVGPARPVSTRAPVPVRPPAPEQEVVTRVVAAPLEPPASDATQPDAARSTSIGHPAEGRIEAAAALPLTGTGFRFNTRRDVNARFATAEVVQAIARAALHVARAMPGSELVVNDLSLERGGPIDHHGSHRAGRDADILFYLLGDDGVPTSAVGAPLDRAGVGFDFKDLARADDDVRVHFDAARTWRFIAALLSDSDASVQRVFVAEHLRSLLLAEAARDPADAAQRERFAELTCQPAYPHDDHLHVRWFCSDEDLGKGCEDLPPVYPWRAAELEAAGITGVMGRLRKARARSKIVTHRDEDREIAKQVVHPAVRAFLARRKHWREQPHPGRRYCR